MQNGDGIDLDLQSLRSFVRASEQGSLTSAATTLGIAQSALSRHIGQLESVLGKRLFHRTGRGVELTELGQKVLPRAQALLADAGEIVKDAHSLLRRPAGVVSVGLLPSLARPLANRLYARVRDECPDIRLRIFEAYSGETEVLLAEGRIDIGIFNHYRPLRRSGHHAVFSTEMCLIAKAGSPALREGSLRFSAFARLPLAMPTRPNNLRALLDDIASRQEVQLQVLMETDSQNVMKDAVINCGLHCVLPRHAVLDESLQGLVGIAAITHPVIRQSTFIGSTRRRPMTDAGKEVLRMLTRLLQEIGAEGRVSAGARAPAAKKR
ncbi:Cyn operon transcriptional activator [Variovorax sp. SRS16]|uniref:LysR family transcriptional regulator n=1 Tax=Variovorax sp. SRS16 TaxID=282217 RepID=UPI001319345E|nr:LysR family transcriptional regulator [Variovorax sp. SRS16]VTU12864.1 Cyn operon transcriptional activator [Variovorax sp. SRS16]